MTGGVKLVAKKIITANHGDDTISIINMEDVSDIKNINLKEIIHKKYGTIKFQSTDSIGPMALSIDRNEKLLVANSWDDSLFKIDMEKKTLLESIKVGRCPINIKIFNNRIYVLNSDSSSLSVIDEKDFNILESINFSGKLTDLQIDERNSHIYIANYDNSDISKISIDTGKISHIKLKSQPFRMIIEEDSIFVLGFLDNGFINYNNLSKINIDNSKVEWSVKLKGTYYDFIKLDKKEYFVLIDSENAYLYKLNPKAEKIDRKIYLGGLPNVIISDGKFLYTNDLLEGKVIILDILDYQIKHRIRVGKEPQGIFLL